MSFYSRKSAAHVDFQILFCGFPQYLCWLLPDYVWLPCNCQPLADHCPSIIQGGRDDEAGIVLVIDVLFVTEVDSGVCGRHCGHDGKGNYSV